MKIDFCNLWDKTKYIIIVLITLVISGSAVANIFPLMTPCRLILAVLFILPFFNSIIHVRGRIPIYLFFYIIMFLISLIANPHNYRYIFSVLFYIVISYAMVHSLDNIRFMKSFLDIMFFMAITSIICYFLLNFTSLNLPFPFYDSYSGIKYGVGFIFNYLPYQKLRNCGMFWEPGLMATFMIFSLLIDSIVFNSPYMVRTMSFICALVLTYSSAGLVLLALFVLFILFKRFGKETISKSELFLLLFVLISAVLVFFETDFVIKTFFSSSNYSLQGLTEKLLTEKLSTSQRMMSITLWWDRFLSSPIIGTSIVDLYNEDFIWDTATSFMFLGLFGFLGCIYTVGWIKGSLQLGISLSSRIVFCVIMLLIVNKEPHGTLMFSWFLLFSLLFNGLTNKNKQNEFGV